MNTEVIPRTTEELVALQRDTPRLRNIMFVGPDGHGTTTLTDALALLHNVYIRKPEDERFCDTRQSEAPRIPMVGMAAYSYLHRSPSGDTLFNCVHAPSTEATQSFSAAMALADGLVVIIEAIEGISVMSERLFRTALLERVRPMVVLNKLDRLFTELRLGGGTDDIYYMMQRHIETVNVIISAYQDPQLGDQTVSPVLGSVVFASATDRWAFTLADVARIYAPKFDLDAATLCTRLWGDWFFDPHDRSWHTTAVVDGRRLLRGFNIVVDMLAEVYKWTREPPGEQLEKILSGMGVKLPDDERLQRPGQRLTQEVMQRFLPVSAVLAAAAQHLPSPIQAQAYRVEGLYAGDQDDATAQAIRQCSPDGPLTVLIASMHPSEDKGRFYALGRVFSGTLQTDQQVTIIGPRYEAGQRHDRWEKRLPANAFCTGRRIHMTPETRAGNLVFIGRIDQYVLRCATLTTAPEPCHFRVTRVIEDTRRAVMAFVQPTEPRDLPRLMEALRYRSLTAETASTSFSDGLLCVTAATERALADYLQSAIPPHEGISIKVSEPTVCLRETISRASTRTATAKSPNKHNRLFMEAKLLAPDLVAELEAKAISQTETTPLSERYGWTEDQVRRLWAIESTNPSNLLYNNVPKVAQELVEIKDSVAAAYNWAIKEGVLCEEPLHGVRFNLLDATLHASAIHRGGGQIIPTARRCMYASVLLAEPRLCEPVFLAQIMCAPAEADKVHALMRARNAQRVDEAELVASHLVQCKYYVTTSNAFGLETEIGLCGSASLALIFHHWTQMEGDPMDPNSRAGTIVASFRALKGMTPRIPGVENYMDAV